MNPTELKEKIQELEQKNPPEMGGWTRDPIGEQECLQGWVLYFFLKDGDRYFPCGSIGDGRLYALKQTDAGRNLEIDLGDCVWEPWDSEDDDSDDVYELFFDEETEEKFRAAEAEAQQKAEDFTKQEIEFLTRLPITNVLHQGNRR